MMTTTCSQCGKPYETKPYLAEKEHHFCGQTCYGEWQRTHRIGVGRNRVTVVCDTCGVPFEKMPSAVAAHNFCGRACFAAWQASGVYAGGKNPAWLGGHTNHRGENWNVQRMAARERDAHTCRHCGVSRKGLPVHHIRPFHLFADYREANALDNLIALCPTCHGTEEVRLWRTHPDLAARRQFPDCAPIRACRVCGGEFQPRSRATEVCDACCTSTCGHCGERFYSRKATQRTIKYCSRQCSAAATARPAQTCVGCGNVYTPRRPHTVFCSRECHLTHSNPRRKSSPTT